jgi:hypothetical protein
MKICADRAVASAIGRTSIEALVSLSTLRLIRLSGDFDPGGHTTFR